MNMDRSRAFLRLAAVRDEYRAARLSLARAISDFGRDSAFVQELEELGLGFSHLKRCYEHVEFTYTIRLFSDFEAVLLDFWQTGLRRRSVPGAQVLIDRVADRRRISPAHRAGAHAVREFRNQVIHDSLRRATLSFFVCKMHLSRYLSWLPESW
jgi:hypothetical protein